MGNSTNWRPVIKINIFDTKIIWPVVLLSTIKALGYSEKILFLVYVAWLGMLILNKKSIVIPRVNGLMIYSAFIIIASLMGPFENYIRHIERDLYYYIPNVVIIVLGYYLAYYQSEKKSIIKTICISGTISSLICVGKVIMNPSFLFNFGNLRSAFSGNVYEVSIAVAVVMYMTIMCKKRIFSKMFDIFMLLIMMMHMFLSMGRIQLVVIATEICVMIIASLLINQEKLKIIKISISILSLVILAFVVIINVMPNDISDVLLDKFANTTEELNSDNEFNSVSDATENWRAYENQSAVKQWEGYNVIEQLLGKGMGEALHAKYIPYSWRRFEMLSGNLVPLLHNGYYTTLIKGGIFGLLALIWLFLANIFAVIKYRKYKKEYRQLLVILSFVTIGMMLNTYVMRGIVAQGTSLYWGLLVGWINREMRLKRSLINS